MYFPEGMSDREVLIQILNKARCLMKNPPSNGALADMILDEFNIERRERMVCGCHTGAHD